MQKILLRYACGIVLFTTNRYFSFIETCELGANIDGTENVIKPSTFDQCSLGQDSAKTLQYIKHLDKAKR